MKKKISVIACIALCVITAALTFQLTFHFVLSHYQKKLDAVTVSGSDFTKLSEAEKLVQELFLGTKDREAMLDGAVKGYIAALNDPYSRYLDANEYNEYIQSLSGASSGIGIRATQDPETGRVVVYDVMSGSPAEEAGIRKGDVLYRVDDVSVSELGFYKAVQALTGAPGTKVKATFLRVVAAKEMELAFTLTRAEVKVNSISYEMLADKIAYVQIYSFDLDTDVEFQKAIEFAVSDGALAIILDVRNNGGGSLEAVTNMLDLILPQGEMYYKTSASGEEIAVLSDEHCIQLPMAVLINGNTASAAELFASVLQSKKVAKVVGTKSFGKATGQKVLTLEDGSAIILSTERFHPAGKDSFDGKGVIPDLEVSLESDNYYLLSHAQDKQLQEAIIAVKQ